MEFNFKDEEFGVSGIAKYKLSMVTNNITHGSFMCIKYKIKGHFFYDELVLYPRVIVKTEKYFKQFKGYDKLNFENGEMSAIFDYYDKNAYLDIISDFISDTDNIESAIKALLKVTFSKDQYKNKLKKVNNRIREINKIK